MWADNETEIDLLGFTYLVDSLEILLTEERLLPLTVGVLGDWGSGKSSLMRMTKQRLDDAEGDPYITLAFSPWRYEDYAHIKTALMAAVVDEISDYLDDHEDLKTKASKSLNRVRSLMTSFKLWKPAAAGTALLAGTDLETAAMTGTVVSTAAAMVPDAKPEEVPRAFETVAHFHVAFSDLVDALGDDVQAIVVFIDDMDRCSTDTIIDTFEAIRLFLQGPKTAYVIGANEPIITAALEKRYPRPAGTAPGADPARNYLEKMIQAKVIVPPLSAPEARTYISLLYASLETDQEDFELLRAGAEQERLSDQLATAMNVAVARAALDRDLDPDLQHRMLFAEAVAPAIAAGLRGNPRQIKQFMNSLEMHRLTADRREMGLDAAKLAKLMVLGELSHDAFERLFVWQARGGGDPQQLRVAEAHVREGGEAPTEDDVLEWLQFPGVTNWLGLEPALVGTPLGAYFTFSRDRVHGLIVESQLALHLQRLLQDLQQTARAARDKAVKDALKLPAPELAELIEVLRPRALSKLDSEAFTALVGIAAKNTGLAAALFADLGEMSGAEVPTNSALRIESAFKGDPRVAELYAKWKPAATGDLLKMLSRTQRA